MKIINADWEKTNIGVSTVEIIVEINDSVEALRDVIDSVDKDYIVCKVNSSNSDISWFLQKRSFFYIEDQVEMEHDLHEIELSRILQRLYDSLPYKLMNEEDIKYLFKEIDKGMFGTDRISLDPKFSKELSANRYKNWIRSLIEKEHTYPYLMAYKGEPAGFVILTTNDGEVYHSVLGGGYEKFRGTGLGMVNKEMEMTRKLGGKKLITSVSSNNANQLKVLVSNGYVPRKVEHVFVLHK